MTIGRFNPFLSNDEMPEQKWCPFAMATGGKNRTAAEKPPVTVGWPLECSCLGNDCAVWVKDGQDGGRCGLAK